MSTTVSSFHRRVDAAAYLASIEVVGAAADALLAETGRSRHAWRVRVAEDALIDAALAAHDSECPAAHDECRCFHGDGDGRFDRRAADSVRRVAAAIGFADAAGIGGRGGVLRRAPG